MKTPSHLILKFIGTCFFLYVAIRAQSVGFTIDESQSVFLAKENSYWDLIRYKKPESNNHFMISVWLKFCLKSGVWQEWILRLPCVLATLVFLRYAYKLSQLISTDKWISIACFILFLANPFVDDFFSLARGYGLGIAFQMASMYYLVRFFDGLLAKNIGKCLFFAALATLGHFMFLNFYLTIAGLVLVILIWDSMVNQFNNGKKIAIYWALITGLLAWFLYVPLTNLIKNGPKNYGSNKGFVADTFQSMVRSSYSGSTDIGDTPVLWAMIYGLLGLTMLVGIFTLTQWLRDRKSLSNLALLMGFATFIGMALVTILLNLCFKQPYPVTRMTIAFYLPMALTISAGFCALQSTIGSRFLAAFWVILALLGFFRAANLTYTIEWAGHALDREIVQWLAQNENQRSEQDKLTITANSYFAPGIHFYTEKQKMKWIKEISYCQPPDLGPKSDYLILYATQRNLVDTNIYQQKVRLVSNEYLAWNADAMIFKKK
jgi:hypothetical protein